MQTIDRNTVETAFGMALDFFSFWDELPSIVSNYSGRGMYGDKCFGIIAPHGGFVTVFFTILAQEAARDEDSGRDVDGEWPIELAAQMAVDNMAMDMVYYFPGWQLSEEKELVESN